MSLEIRGLEEAQRAVESRATKLYQALALETFSRIIQRSPVDTGRFRANWRFSVQTPDTGTSADTDQSGSRIGSAARAFVRRLTLRDDAVMANSLPYAVRLEFGGYGDGPKTIGGFSRQAPQGMVGVTAAEVQPLANQIAAEVARDVQLAGITGAPS